MDDDGHIFSRADLMTCLLKPASDRTPEDIDIIFSELIHLHAFQTKFDRMTVHAMSSVVEFESCSDAGHILFRQGDPGAYWYVIYRGAVEVKVSNSGDPADALAVCSLCAGHDFGELALLNDEPRKATVVSREACELLKVHKDAFKRLIERMHEKPTHTLESTIEESEELPQTTCEDLDSAVDEIIAPRSGDDDSAIDLSASRPLKMSQSVEIEEEEEQPLHRDVVRECLEKRPEERNMDDIEDILTEMNHIKAFSHLTSSVRTELCRVILYDVVEKAGGVLFRQGDEGTSWYVISKGSVNVEVNGIVVCALQEGEGFGELALVNDKPRAATIVTRQDDCHFWRVEKDDFKLILKDIERNTLTFEEHGQVVMVMENRVMNDEKQRGYVVMTATPEKLTERLEEDNSGDNADPAFMEDFLLMYRTMMTPMHLWEKLMARFHHVKADTVGKRVDNHKSKVAVLIYNWIIRHPRDFDDALYRELVAFSEILCKDNMEEEYLAIRSEIDQRSSVDTGGRGSLSSPSSPRKLRKESSINAPNPPAVSGQPSSPVPGSNVTPTMSRKEPNRSKSHSLSKSHKFFGSFRRLTTRYSGKDAPELMSSLSASTLPDRRLSVQTAQPNAAPEIDVLRVYRADESYKTLAVTHATSASELVDMVMQKFNMDAPRADYCLTEIKSTGEVRTFAPKESSIHSSMSLNGRLYIKHVTAEEQLAPSITSIERTTSPVLEMDTRELAKQLTLHDFELFARIDPVEYINQVWKRIDAMTANINTFTQRFNQVNLWVVTEICITRQVNKRVLVVKKFIKMAKYLRAANNFNSLFAVLSGLSNVSVSRLVGTWEKVPHKYIELFEELNSLMDPSRNMKSYRMLLINATPPLIPFFPILMKDLFFIHEGNDAKVKGLINYDKLRMISKIVRFADGMRSMPYDPQMLLQEGSKRRTTVHGGDDLSEKSVSAQRIEEYVKSFQVIDDQRVLANFPAKSNPPVAHARSGDGLSRQNKRIHTRIRARACARTQSQAA
eukprot:Opistho-2@5463